MGWFVEQLPTLNLSARFSGMEMSLGTRVGEQSVRDKSQYLNSICFDVVCGSKQFASQMHFFENYPHRSEGKFVCLCHSIFATPFSNLDPKLLRDCHRESLKESSKKQVIEFIREHIDHEIENIELDEQDHFRVLHNKISPNPDLTVFGEGLQRIFKLGLLFAGAKDGVVIIDEFENAVHASLLGQLTSLVYALAQRFNVQVFICSHSKECIDAFANNESIPNEEISAYGLIRGADGFECKHFDGGRLHRLIAGIDFDLRGGGKQ